MIPADPKIQALFNDYCKRSLAETEGAVSAQDFQSLLDAQGIKIRVDFSDEPGVVNFYTLSANSPYQIEEHGWDEFYITGSTEGGVQETRRMNQQSLEEALDSYELYNIDFESKEFKDGLDKIVLYESTQILLKRVMLEALDYRMILRAMQHVAGQLRAKGNDRALSILDLQRVLQALARGDREYTANPVAGEKNLRDNWLLNRGVLDSLKTELARQKIGFYWDPGQLQQRPQAPTTAAKAQAPEAAQAPAAPAPAQATSKPKAEWTPRTTWP